MQSYIKDWLEANEDEQLVVFGVHREPLQELAKYFKAPIIQGGVSADKKQQIVNEFSQRKHRLLFANIQSAGKTASEPSWWNQLNPSSGLS